MAKRKATSKGTVASESPDTNSKVLVQEVLRLSVTNGSFIDTKIYAFSRQRRTGVVDEPLPVYANSEMLRASSKYFDGCEYFYPAVTPSMRCYAFI